MKRNYPIEHQKQLRKYWKDLPPEEKTSMMSSTVVQFQKMVDKNNNIEERRTQRMYNLIQDLKKISGEPLDLKELLAQAEKYRSQMDDTQFIDSIIFPSLDQVSSIPRFVLHFLGREIIKKVNDYNFSKLITQLEEKEKAKGKDTSSKAGSKTSKAKKSSQKHASTKDKSLKESIQTSPQSHDDAAKIKEANLDIELKLVSKELGSGESEWLTCGGNKKRRLKKRGSNDVIKTNQTASHKAIEETPKAMSLRGSDIGGVGEIKRTYSSTNPILDDLQTNSVYRTLSTKTESKVQRSQEVTNIYSRPEVEVREEDDMSAEDTISRKSNRGSVDHNQNASVDHKKNLRTNSIEREIKKKPIMNTRIFKPRYKNDSNQNGIDKLISGKDGKKALVNLYSENIINEIMKNSHNKKESCFYSPYNTSKGQMASKAQKSNPSLQLDFLKTDADSGSKNSARLKTQESSAQNKKEDPSSPTKTQGDKTPVKKEKKLVFSTVINKPAKWEVDEIDKRDKPKVSPVTLEFDKTKELKKDASHSKIDIKKGFQKYLSSTMTLEQGELFFKNYLNYSITECVSKLKSNVNSGEPFRISAFKRVRNIITQTLKSIKSSLQVYGSWVTGLMIESSDIDLCIKRHESLDRYGIQCLLESLECNFRKFKWVIEAKGIYTATVPVLKLTIDPRIEYSMVSEEADQEFVSRFISKSEDDFSCSGLSTTFRPVSVDITVNDLNMTENVGLRTTQYIQHSLQYYPFLGDLVILIKSFLARNDLNNSYKGGLGSYAICLLTIAYLEYRKKTKREDTISDLLIGMFKFYGTEFNPTTHGISPSYRQDEYSTTYLSDTWNPYFEIPTYLKMHPLVILDPTQFMINNIAANAYQVHSIQDQFSKAFMAISIAKQRFFEELHKEIKDQGGVKKDYFLSYHKKKDKALDMSENILEEVLGLKKPILT